MEGPICVFLGIKVKPGPIERHKLENFSLDNTVDRLKSEAEKKANIPSASLGLYSLIHMVKHIQSTKKYQTMILSFKDFLTQCYCLTL